MGDDTEWLKLPPDEKVQHKAWKARQAGYEECAKLFARIDDEKSPEFQKFLGLVRKFVVESNAIAHEKAMEATLAFVENAAVAVKIAAELVAGIVNKCLNSPRAKVKEKALEICLMIIEIDRPEVAQEELINGFANKQPKIVAGSVEVLRVALAAFGHKVMPIKPMIKHVHSLLDHRDKIVREETKQLVVEMYHWVREAIRPQLTSLKPVQIQELDSEFEKLGSAPATQSRFMRSQQDLREQMEAKAAAAATEGAEGDEGSDGEVAVAEEVDPYDLLDPVDIIAKLPKDFYEKIEAKKWQERKEVLEAALELVTKNLKLEAGDYGDLCRALKKVVAKDSNVMLVVIAAKTIAGLAAGLRKKFSPYAVVCLQAILEKFKEKKANVLAALREAADALYPTTSLEAITEDLIAALDNKNPSIKAETAGFISRAFCRCTPTTLPKKLLKMYVAALLKIAGDSAPEVRENVFSALGAAWKVVGEKAMMAFLADVDHLKMEKIKESMEKTILVDAKGNPRAGGGGSGGAAASKAAKSAPTASAAAAPPAKTAKKPGVATAAPADAKKGKGKSEAKKGPTKGSAAAPGAERTERLLTPEEIEEKANEMIGASVVTQLASPNWKERLAGMESLVDRLRTIEPKELEAQVVVGVVLRKPGLKDTNFQVLKLRLDSISQTARTAPALTSTVAGLAIPDVVDKIGDVKNGAAAKEALSCLSEATSLKFVSELAMKSGSEQKNPKNQAETFVWMAEAIKEFGFAQISTPPQIKALIDYSKKALAHSNPGIRAGGINLLGVMFLYMGAKIRTFVEDEKPATLATIDAEFEKLKGEKPPAPTRGKTAGGGDDDEDDDAAGEGDDGVDLDDLVPRTDVGAKFDAALITELADKNWKVRGEALDKVKTILSEAKFISPNLGELPPALKARLSDSNKILQGVTLGICETIATAMGAGVKRHVAVLGPGMIQGMADSKPAQREKVVSALNAWVSQTTINPFCENEILVDALTKGNPFLKAELFSWLAFHLPNAKKPPTGDLESCVPIVFAALEDRTPEVRNKSVEVLTPFMIHLGFDKMVRATGKLSASSKKTVMEALEKAREKLPPKPEKKKKAPPVAAVAPVPADVAPATKTAWMDEDASPEEPTSKAATKTVRAGGKPGRGGGRAARPGASRKKEEEEDTEPPLTLNDAKQQRMKDEERLKSLKWNFAAPREEFVEQLKTQMTGCLSKSLMANLFHADFKFQLKGLDTLLQCAQGETYREAMVGQLDLVLRYISLRTFDTNTTVILKCLDVLTSVFANLADDGYHLLDFEAYGILPYLVNRVGDPKDAVRKGVRGIFSIVCKVYPASKLFSYLMSGLASKNSRQRAECLEELGNLVDIYGIHVCQPSPALAFKDIGKQIGDRDNSVRNAALNTVVAAYHIVGDQVYKYMGRLSDKDLSYVEERIKRSGNVNKQTRAPPTPAPESSTRAGDHRSRSQDPKDSKRRTITAASASEPLQQLQQQQLQQHRQQPAYERIFTLELDALRPSDSPINTNLPKLCDHSQMDQLFREPVPKLPESRTHLLVASAPRVGSTALANSLRSTQDVSAAFDLVIAQVASNEVSVALSALVSIDGFLCNKERDSSLMRPHVDQFLIAVSLQLRMAYTKHMADCESSGGENVIQLYKFLIAATLSLFDIPPLAKSSSKDVLQNLFNNLLTVLLDSRLIELPEGEMIPRTINVMVVRIVEQADPTNCLCALIHLLLDCLNNEGCSNKFRELVMKCLWKLTKILPHVIQDVNVDKVLFDLDLFLREYPNCPTRDEKKEKGGDLAIKTIKTIAHSLARLKGEKILSHLTLITTPNSEIEVQLRKILKSSTFKSSAGGGGGGGGNSNKRREVDSGLGGDAKAKENRFSNVSHDAIAEIFHKIGAKDRATEGLNDLYDLKQANPGMDLEPFLVNSTAFFKNYIENGLKSVEVERRRGGVGVGDASGEPTPSSMRAHSRSLEHINVARSGSSHSLDGGLANGSTATVPTSSSTEAAPGGAISRSNFYKERLKVLRAQCGLDNPRVPPIGGGAFDGRDPNAFSKPPPAVNEDDEAPPVRGSFSLSGSAAAKAAAAATEDPEAEAEGGDSGKEMEDLKRRLAMVKSKRKM